MNHPLTSFTFGTTLVVACFVAGPLPGAAAETPAQVTKLLHDKISLQDCQDRTKTTLFKREDFRGSWPVVTNPLVRPRAGFLVVIVGKEEYCVNASEVETNIKMIGKGRIDDKDRGGAASGRK
jgi:hypothetical protein